MIEDVLEDFDFDKVRKVMEFLDWGWAGAEKEVKVPSLYRLVKHADILLHEVTKEDINEVSAGGFRAVKDEDGNLELRFEIEKVKTFTDDYK